MCRFAILACVLLLVSSEDVIPTARSMVNSTELCGTKPEIQLTKSGDLSTMTVTLSPLEHNSVCKIRVRAPSTHVVYLQFVEPEFKANSQKRPPCVMSIFLPQNSRLPVWKGDLCADTPPTEVDLLTSDFKIIWNPPENPTFTNGRKFVLTAVGRGQVCKEPEQHTCMKIGWAPEMCVAENLLCDGFVNCPKGYSTSDEDQKLCKKSFYAPKTLEQLALELFKWKPPDTENNKWLQSKLEQYANTPPPKRTFFNWRDWQDVKKPDTTTTTTTTEAASKKPPKATDSISQVLSKYGPWGYLMLGMLICGTVLMFCGLWECCFRKHKTEVEPGTSQTQPTTVLIINPQDENSPSPPNYDELDLPPSYTTLFPSPKVNQNPSDSAQNAELNESASDEMNSSDSTDISTIHLSDSSEA